MFKHNERCIIYFQICTFFFQAHATPNTYREFQSKLQGGPKVVTPTLQLLAASVTKYVLELATNLRAISLNVGVTTFGPPCIKVVDSLETIGREIQLHKC